MSLKTRQKPHVLYFAGEAYLTDAQQRELDAIAGARHRNAALIDPEHPLEKNVTCVAGPAVPPNYEHFPFIEATVDEAEEEEEEEAEEGADYDAMTVPQLKKLLDEAEVEYPPTAKKAALVALA